MQVLFPGGTYRPGDHWLVAARTATADVAWPRDPGGRPLRRPPDGIEHRYAQVALVRVSGGGLELRDCRDRFPSLTTLTATDVAVESGIDLLPDVDNVQEALDELAKQRDLPRHHRLLHGWGIVCGLQVQCGGDQQRREVEIHPGSAIDTKGKEIELIQRAQLDVMTRIEQLEAGGTKVLENGNGDISLFLDPARGDPPFGIEKYDPNAEEPPDLFNGTLLLDFYNDCIKSLHDWLRGELTPPPGDEGLPVGPAQQRLAALINLIAQPVNRKSGRNVFISPREHDLLIGFYDGLKDQLQSETFCAMFDNARQPPAYPDALKGPPAPLNGGRLDTIFGSGGHTRLRLRPGGKEAYTVGAGIDPLKPVPVINRYDLVERRMVARIDPIAGEVVTADTSPDPGTGAVADVAFSPDGARIYVVVPTRNEDNTIFRVGDITDQGVTWRPMVTICGVKLVTLATTAADPAHVYAIGLRKVTGTRDGRQFVEWHGAGLYQINPEAPDPNLLPTVGPNQDFFPFGHLLISDTGLALATAMNGDVEATRYTQVAQIQVPAGAPAMLDLPGDLGGTDDIATLDIPRQGREPGRTLVYAVVDVARGKSLAGFDLREQAPLPGEPVPVQDGSGAVRLLDVGNQLLAVISADEYSLRLLPALAGSLVPNYLLPMQVGPISIAADESDRLRRSPVYVLNYISNTLSVAERELFDPEQPFDPRNELADYRKAMLEAYADLLAGFLQYLKDCLFDHFLVRCPPEDLQRTLYLASVSIRGNRVYKVCNFSRRHYVKSFPTVGYWLSLVPVLRLLNRHLADIACMVLPEYFSKLSVQDDSDKADRVSVQQLEQVIAWAQSSDLPGRWGELRQRNTVVANAARVAVASARPQALRPGGRRVVSSDVVGQPTDRVSQALGDKGITVRRAPFRPTIGPGSIGDVAALFRDAQPGDEITLFEEEGVVRYFAVSKRPARPELATAQPEAQLAERVAALEQELAALRTQVGRRTTRSTKPKPSN